MTHRTWLKAGRNQKTDSRKNWLNLIEKLYCTTVDSFCRYNSDNNINIIYIKNLQQCPQSLLRKILLDNITSCTYVHTSHPVWHSQPSIATWKYMVDPRLDWRQSKLSVKLSAILKLGKHNIIPYLQCSFGTAMYYPCWSRLATPVQKTGMYKEAEFKHRA